MRLDKIPDVPGTWYSLHNPYSLQYLYLVLRTSTVPIRLRLDVIHKVVPVSLIFTRDSRFPTGMQVFGMHRYLYYACCVWSYNYLVQYNSTKQMLARSTVTWCTIVLVCMTYDKHL